MSNFNEFRSVIRKEDLDQVKRLFRREYVNYEDDMGWTPLHWACGYNKNIEIVKYLLDEGSDIEAETKNDKWRPIHLAVFNGFISIVKELIARKCSISAKTERGETPLDVAVQWRKDDCANILYASKRHSIPDVQQTIKRVSTLPNCFPTADYNATLPMPSLKDFKKGNLLGRGGFGQVYKCFDQQTGRDLAMKEVFLGSKDMTNKDAESLVNEVSIYKRLMSHPRIVQYFGTMQDETSMYIFMEYMAGGSIKEQLNQYGPLAVNIIAKYAKQILEGLAFLHHKMIIHRDIKCNTFESLIFSLFLGSNILRDIYGNVKLGDFGTSKYLQRISIYSVSRNTFLSNNSENSKDHTSTDTFCGTVYWMAPEVIRAESYSIPADIWSLGATLVEMLTGFPPYHDLEPCAAIFKIGAAKKFQFQPPSPICPKLQSFIDKIFVINQRKRPNVCSLLKYDFILNVD